MIDLNIIFSTNTILQSITVGIIVYFIRLWLEQEFNKLSENKFWTGCILPSLALIISLLFSFLLPFNKEMITSEKVAYGLICGFSSSFLFSTFKAFLNKQMENK